MNSIPERRAAYATGLDGELLGVSAAMRALHQAARDVAASPIPVLIIGEPGVGKSAFARHIHMLSPRRKGLFQEVKAAELTPEVVIKLCKNGSERDTVLVQSLGELPVQSQSQVIDSWLTRDKLDIAPRLVASTVSNLEEEIRDGRFRQDLYYRIAGLCLRIPPLRHRREDIQILLDHFLAKYSALFQRERAALSGPVMQYLLDYEWPGNVRELEYAAKTIAALGDEKLALVALRAVFASERTAGNGSYSLKDVARAASRSAERELILRVLASTRWNRKRAAEDLKISYKALLYKLKQMGLTGS